MPKINQEEYEVLKALDSRAKSIVRQARGWLWVAEQPIMKDDRSWFVADGFDEKLKDDNLFQFIQWEDGEPYNIAELIKEYKSSLIKSTPWTPNPLDFESEEIGMKKDIEWFKKEFDEVIEFRKQSNPSSIWDMVINATLKYIKENFKNLINQLDEPEVLSQEWIDKHRKSYTMEDSVEISDLQNLLVQKQEEVDRAYKDGYEKGREHGFYKGYREGLGYKGSESEALSQEDNINIVLDDLKEHIKEQQSLSQNVGMAHTPAGNDTHYRQYDYVLECIDEYEPSDDLKELLVPKQKELESTIKVLIEAYKQEEGAHGELENGWISGFIKDLKNLVEEEPLYYVIDKSRKPLLRAFKEEVGMSVCDVTVEETEALKHPNFKYRLTEQEIKDYDDRFWPFAVPVEATE